MPARWESEPLRRLRANESYDELLTLAACDEGGRQVGVQVPDVDEVARLRS